jgi:hypothetical protein
MRTSTNRIVHTSDSRVATAQRTSRKGIARIAAVSSVQRFTYCPHVGDVIDTAPTDGANPCEACATGDR